MITDFKSNGGTNGALESGAPAVPNAIEVKHIVKKYGDFTAVDDVSFSVKEEEIFGLLGPNGAGKSTLIRMMTTLIPITAGTARVAGHDVQKEADAARRAIGVIPQALTSDLDLTIEENLNIYAKLYDVPAKKRKAAIDELLETDRLCDAIAIVDHGKLIALDTPAALKASVPGSNVIEAQFVNAPADWEQRLQSLSGVTSVKHEGAGMYRVLTGNGSRTTTELVEMAVQAGVDVKSLSVQNTTLDDVFVHYTGRQLRDELQKAYSFVMPPRPGMQP